MSGKYAGAWFGRDHSIAASFSGVAEERSGFSLSLWERAGVRARALSVCRAEIHRLDNGSV